ncbi:lipopolysaccharide assembly protein LapB [Tenacibaculum singaporense]|uniref:Tetratricopeptide repeat protein n=1 Tax=Tenacibaculum singaporense TaxID=2358479 RepID=A0A3S8R6Y9_9FLAO|nr:tetratricopeptide repeat protein [Tenacibaculum singaporense]AZJ35526.1 tetratricopeptide repeat protein [Tenacibaculum singaporense]
MKQIKVLFFSVLFLPLTITANSVDEIRIDLDSVLLKKLKKKYSFYKRKGLNKKTIIYADSILNLLKKGKENQELALAYNRVGYLHYRNKAYDKAYKNYEESKAVYKKLNDSLNVASRLLALAKLESNFDLFLKSDSTAIEVLKYSNNNPKFNEIECSTYNCLGINSRKQRVYNQAIDYYNQAIQITNDSLKRVRYIANKAVVYKYEKNYREAVKIYEELIKNKFFDEIDLKLKFKIIDNYTYTKHLLGQEINTRDFFKVQRLKDSIKDYEGLITNYSYISDYFYNKNSDKSLFYAQKMYDLSKERERPNDRIEAIDKLIKLVKGNEIRKYAIERSYLKDSIIDARRKSRNKLVKTIYNFDLLKEQKLKAEIKTEQQKSQKQLWIFTVILTILSSIVYFFYKREKNKKKKP